MFLVRYLLTRETELRAAEAGPSEATRLYNQEQTVTWMFDNRWQECERQGGMRIGGRLVEATMAVYCLTARIGVVAATHRGILSMTHCRGSQVGNANHWRLRVLVVCRCKGQVKGCKSPMSFKVI